MLLNPSRCCCGEVLVPDPCKISCLVCGGVNFDPKRVYAIDSNGTWQLSLIEPELALWSAMDVPRGTGVGYKRDGLGGGQCSAGSTGPKYNYTASCTGGGGLAASMEATYMLCYPPDFSECSAGWAVEKYDGDWTTGIDVESATLTCYSDRAEIDIVWRGTFDECSFDLLTVVDSTKFVFYFAADTAAPRECCSPCPIPNESLRVAWENEITGDGNGSLPQVGGNLWRSACLDDDQLAFELYCDEGRTKLRVYYGDDACTFDGDFCDAIDWPVSELSCEPYAITWVVTASNCPDLYSLGYRSLRIYK